jgi:hypothetical protein
MICLVLLRPLFDWSFRSANSYALWGREQPMTLDFLDGVLMALMPSMLMVAWLVWRADTHQNVDY